VHVTRFERNQAGKENNLHLGTIVTRSALQGVKQINKTGGGGGGIVDVVVEKGIFLSLSLYRSTPMKRVADLFSIQLRTRQGGFPRL
jgi:hypothetical protein